LGGKNADGIPSGALRSIDAAMRTDQGMKSNCAAECPICGGTTFVAGPKGRMSPNGMLPRCATCQSLERHRMFRIMFERLGVDAFADMRAIQFSPDPTLDPKWFRSFELSVYGEGKGIDIQSIDKADGAYEFVACSHVLEHVADDRKALRELLRITSATGLLFLVVPDPFREEKTRDWGFAKPEKHGHFRVYGADIAERFSRYLPNQAVFSYMGEDPVTGERDGCFLLPKSAQKAAWIEARLQPNSKLFSGPSRAL
jgi:SAM-dependent methyltransferase